MYVLPAKRMYVHCRLCVCVFGICLCECASVRVRVCIFVFKSGANELYAILISGRLSTTKGGGGIGGCCRRRHTYSVSPTSDDSAKNHQLTHSRHSNAELSCSLPAVSLSVRLGWA